mgnify:FL=1
MKAGWILSLVAFAGLHGVAVGGALLTPSAIAQVPPPPPGETLSPGAILADSPDSDWRPLEPRNTLYIEFPEGRVIIEMAEGYAPRHVANVRSLAGEGYFLGGAVTRVQDNFVAQWAQAASNPRRPIRGEERLPAEFTQPRSDALAFTPLPDPDTFAPEVGFSDGFAAARDGDETWLTHCYGVVGVGRETDRDSGGGTELYAVIGQAPRHLDRNLTVLGRVVQGIELLSSLPRGTADMSFYATRDEYARFTNMALAANVPEEERTPLEVLRTDSATWEKLVNHRRWRKDDFYQVPAGRIGVCNLSVPVRAPQ